MKKIILLLASSVLTVTATYAAPNDKGSRPDFSQLCKGKAINTKVSTKHDGRTMNGTCQLRFVANNPASLERGAQRDSTIQNACKGKTKGTTTSVTLNGKNIPGKCDISFKPEMQNR